MNFRFLFVVFVAFQGQFLWSQDSIALAEKTQRFFHPIKEFGQTLEGNPSIKGFSNADTRSELGAWISRDKNTFQLQQLGEGVDQFEIRANSFYKLDTTSSVWGTADYKNGLRKNVRWNESSDYDKIYPFVTADSVGGDLDFETYAFQGGYAFKRGKYNFGIHAGFKALMEYRSVDPRPKNISSDLNLGVGASRLIFGSYRLAADLSGEKYTQTNSITFFSELGNPALYHMGGLGTFNKLLYGTRKKAQYEGWGYGLGLQWYNEERPDWFFQLRWKNFELEKSITEATPFVSSKIEESALNVNLGKVYQSDRYTWGVQLGYQRNFRKGTENILSNGVLGGMLIIGSIENYNDLNQHVLVEGLFSVKNSGIDFGFSPFVIRNSKEEKQLLTQSKMKIDAWTYGLKTTLSKAMNNGSIWHVFPMLSVKRVDYAQNRISPIPDQPQINTMLLQNYDRLAANNFSADLRIRCDFKLGKRQNVFWELSAQYQHYKTEDNNGVQAALGITF